MVLASSLLISEVMYHPAAAPPGSSFEDDDYEYIELANISETQRVNLHNYAITQGVTFTFPDVTLAPHARIVVARDEAAFRERYGAAIQVAGQYGGGPTGERLSNGGETVQLVDPRGQMVQQFTYDDTWYPITDGDGYSLEVKDLTVADADRWRERLGWHSSRRIGGSPGSRAIQGDFNNNGQRDANDIDRLFREVGNAQNAHVLDLTADQRLDTDDVDHLVTDLLNTYYGDTDLDGDVDQFDIINGLVNVSPLPTSKGWADGDFDGDRDVDEADLAQLSANFTGHARTDVVISEFLASNDNTLRDGNGQSSDWIELYYGGRSPLNLKGYRLTDSADDLAKWTFPDLTIPPGGYLVVFASGVEENQVDAAGHLHTNFKLSAQGEYLALVSPGGRLISEFDVHGISYPPQRTDVSFGIAPDANSGQASVGYMVDPTPGAENSKAFVDFVTDTRFSVDRGYFDAPVEVEVTSATPGANIRYTLDGTSPSATHGTVYSGAIMVDSTTTLRAAAFKEGYLPTNVDTQSYLFFDSVARQTKPEGYPELNSGDYDVDPDVALGPIYGERIRQGLTSIPTLSLVMQQEDFVGPRGIYTNTQQRGMGSERPVSAELINPDGTPGFQIDAGVRIQGGASRNPNTTAKHSFSLRFRNSYGTGRLNHPLFPNSPVTSFDSLSIRGGSNNTWPVGERLDRRRATYIRDQYIRDALLEMGNPDAGRGIYVHLYINGLYWGLYNVTERVDAAHVSEYLGGTDEDYDARNGAQVLDGTADAFNEMQEIAKGGDWQAIQSVIDIDNYIDFSIITTYGSNGDIASTRNHRSAGGGPNRVPWRLYSWDAEEVFYNPTSFGLGADPFNIFRDLEKHEEFRVRYGDRVHQHFFNGGALTSDRAVERWIARFEELDLAIIGESARWGDHRRADSPYSRDEEWLDENTRIIKEHLPQRREVVLDLFRELELYPRVVAPVFNQHGGLASHSFSLEMSAPAGTVYYTLDGSDPWLSGGAVAEHAMVYSDSVTLDQDVTVKARALVAGQWSALVEADFMLASDFPIRITELNFRPHGANPVAGLGELDTDNDRFEFVELVNTAEQPIDLAGLRLVEQSVNHEPQGIEFQFAPQTLAPGEHIVVVRDPLAFQSRYGDVPRIAEGNDGSGGSPRQYAGRLSNSGERIALLDGTGRVIQMFDYARAVTSLTRASGLGSSLEVVSTDGDYNDASNWRASSEYGGSPGAAGLGPDRRVMINEVLAHAETPGGDWIELHNTTSSDISLADWYLGDSEQNLLGLRLPGSTIIPAGGYQTLRQSELGFELSETFGGSIWLIEPDASGRPVRFVDQVQFGTTSFGVSVGRTPLVDDPLVALSHLTPGEGNTDPLFSVIISELHYNPPDPDGPDGWTSQISEFVELHNPTNSDVDLTGWHLTGDVEFTFEDVTTIAAGQTMVLVAFNPRRVTISGPFRELYALNSDFPLIGTHVGVLGNTRGRVRLERPAAAPPELPYFIPYIVVDEVHYDSSAPWPSSPLDGQESISRTSPLQYGSLAHGWSAGRPTPGSWD